MKGRPAPARNIIIDGKLLPELLDEDTIHSVVHGFYDRIRKDDLLAPLFAQFIPAEDWPVHLAKMCDFLLYVCGFQQPLDRVFNNLRTQFSLIPGQCFR